MYSNNKGSWCNEHPYIVLLAQRLSAYDDETWKKLKPQRRATYMRAAFTLFCNPQTFYDAVMKVRGKWAWEVSKELEAGTIDI